MDSVRQALRTPSELLDQMVEELGYRRKGARIVERLTRIIRNSS
jgi:hypothetical protein